MESQAIRRAYSTNPDSHAALLEIKKATEFKEEDFILFFFSPNYPNSEIAKHTSSLFGVHSVGCSTAGEIGPAGYIDNGISAMVFKKEDFLCCPFLIESISNVGCIFSDTIGMLERCMYQNCNSLGEDAKSFVITLFDGLSVKEEQVIGQLGISLPGIPVLGGSAGDKLNFKATHIYYNGKTYQDCALFLGVSTLVPFKVFKTQHFIESKNKVVITKSDPEKRIVYEMDGLPAAQSYADTLKLKVNEFSPQIFSKNPVMLKIGENFYVRSVQKANEDGSLTFFCAIDDGLVLTLAEKANIKKITENEFETAEKELGGVDSVLAFECILRKLEVDGLPQSEREEVQKLYRKFNVVGFHTYGEQFGSVHVNQTLTGVAFGKKNQRRAA